MAAPIANEAAATVELSTQTVFIANSKLKPPSVQGDKPAVAIPAHIRAKLEPFSRLF